MVLFYITYPLFVKGHFRSGNLAKTMADTDKQATSIDWADVDRKYDEFNLATQQRDKQNAGSSLQELLDILGWDTRELALRIQVREQTPWRWLKGERFAQAENLAKLRQVLLSMRNPSQQTSGSPFIFRDFEQLTHGEADDQPEGHYSRFWLFIREPLLDDMHPFISKITNVVASTSGITLAYCFPASAQLAEDSVVRLFDQLRKRGQEKPDSVQAHLVGVRIHDETAIPLCWPHIQLRIGERLPKGEKATKLLSDVIEAQLVLPKSIFDAATEDTSITIDGRPAVLQEIDHLGRLYLKRYCCKLVDLVQDALTLNIIDFPPKGI